MKKILLPIVALAALTTAVAVLATGGGCESDSCTKDNDCELPLVCVNSACVTVGPRPDVTPGEDAGEIPETDTPPVEGDSEADGETIETTEFVEDGDVPDEPEAETDDGGGCTPVTSTPTTMGTTGAADVDERPSVVRSGEGFVTLIRPPGPVSADGLRFQRFATDGRATTSAMWTLSSVEISPVHPIVELPPTGAPPTSPFATAFAVPAGAGPGIWLKVVPATGTGGEVPRQVPGTDANSSEPTITFDETDVIVAWSQNTAGTVDIRGQHFNATTGEALGSPVTIASGPSGTKEPRILWATGGFRHTLAYFSGSDGLLHVLSLDGTLAVQSDNAISPPTGHSYIGYASLAWNGTVFGLAWETRGTSDATIHLATFMPGEAPTDHTPLAGSVSLSNLEAGQIALAWGDSGDEWGIAWRYSQTGRQGISLARVNATDFTLLEAPVDIRLDTSAGLNPSLAYNAGFYMIVWAENPGGILFPVYEATRGCTP
jgi:hypothetical protein